MGGLEKYQGGTYRIEVHRLSLLNHNDLLKGKVTLTSDDPHPKVSTRRPSLRAEAQVPNFFTPSHELPSFCNFSLQKKLILIKQAICKKCPGKEPIIERK